MGYKNRGYQRDVPLELVRDYKLFAIACEGSQREPQYFNIFQYMSNRIKVDLIEDYVKDDELLSVSNTKSSPNWVLNRAMKYIEKNDLKDDDELWFVIDTDDWTSEQIRLLLDCCKDHENWNIVLSNPCFEIWLYFHKKANIEITKSETCNQFKYEISTFDSGGYNKYRYIPLIDDAIRNSKNADSDIDSNLPNFKESLYNSIEYGSTDVSE
ncbi:MAG: RloB family protein, partial [Candidatus Delongbacteria bacterium]|nr:RloB family protein [Candidatus Delongbacteria bacterium]